jgi:hypothetical protein
MIDYKILTRRALCLLLTISLLFSITLPIKAYSISDAVQARITNVEYGDEIVTITYDLIGPTTDQYEVSIVFLKKSDSTFTIKPETISGNIGRGAFAGSGRKIIWDFKKDYPKGFEGDDYYFKISVKQIPKEGGFPWLLVGGGAALLGGGAAILLLNKKSDTAPPAAGDLPGPPGRPQ